MELLFGIQDVTVTSTTSSKTVVRQGCNVSINITVENQGYYTETFNLTAYANTTIITTLTNITLTSGNSTNITFTWNTTGVPYGYYTITANATSVPGESETADNTFENGWGGGHWCRRCERRPGGQRVRCDPSLGQRGIRASEASRMRRKLRQHHKRPRLNLVPRQRGTRLNVDATPQACVYARHESSSVHVYCSRYGRKKTSYV